MNTPNNLPPSAIEHRKTDESYQRAKKRIQELRAQRRKVGYCTEGNHLNPDMNFMTCPNCRDFVSAKRLAQGKTYSRKKGLTPIGE